MNIMEAFELLDVSINSTLGEIKKAWRKKAKQYHPDVMFHNTNNIKKYEKKFKQINKAYEIILQHKKESEKIVTTIEFTNEDMKYIINNIIEDIFKDIFKENI